MHSLRLLALFAVLAACLLRPARTAAQTYGQPATPRIVAYVEVALQQGNLQLAAALVAQYRRSNGDTPEALEALSWVARGELAAGHVEEATKEAEEIKRISQVTLGTRKLDAEPHLPLALGAALEIEAEAMAATQGRAEAVRFLQAEMRTWSGTSLVERLQKNLNELTLEGRPLPVLREPEWIGRKPAPISTLRGKVLLLFFWAHWCADCKAEAPVIAKLGEELEPKGLVIVAPTRLYGYTATDEHAAPSEEKPFIEKVYERYYGGIPNAQVPVDESNFQRFGVSTTPTIVVVDRRGIVRLYHPGLMDEAALRSTIEPLLLNSPNARAAR
ncbi:MAG: TlpA family protein disulfide reductase [Acidobacteriaceae bacterium]|nr:TlpA family protein disulfide reductase [Acidobacteriaceae bacterium]MBV9294314.1 TlpA family protein disulfide reductase [Acidobacteriaceae bacterium]